MKRKYVQILKQYVCKNKRHAKLGMLLLENVKNGKNNVYKPYKDAANMK
jgi:hypothetical protein